MKRIRIIALIAAFIFFISGYSILSSRDDKDDSESVNVGSQQIMVVVAQQDISPYTTLTDEMLSLEPMVISDNMTGYFTDIEEVAGKACISDIFTGEMVTQTRVTEVQDVAMGLANRIADGKRAISIEVGLEQGVANNLKVGNRVDLIFSGAAAADGGANSGIAAAGILFDAVTGVQGAVNSQVMHDMLGQEYSLIALQDLKVAALGDVFYFRSGADYEAQEYISVTLEVTPAEAAQIILMKDTGRIHLMLRPQNDDSVIYEPRDSILKNYEIEEETTESIPEPIQP